jgi:hypothetical protein
MEVAKQVRGIRRSRREWARSVAAASRSGLTLTEFGHRHGISGRQLSWWKWELSREARAAGKDLTEGSRRRCTPAAAAPVTFIEARVLDDESGQVPAGTGSDRELSRAMKGRALFELELGLGRLTWCLEWRG